MTTYFLFGKYSSDAIKGMGPDRTEKAAKLVKEIGGEIKSVYALLGEKDLVIIASFPDSEKALKSLIIRAGNGDRTHDPQLGKLMLYH